MTSDESPAVARRRLRLALRKAREAKGLTQSQVAGALYWSLSKVQRIESGDVTVSATDVQALLIQYDITNEDQVRRLVADARAARRRGWWDDPRLREHLTPATMELLQFESQATMIRFFSLSMVPGIFQTPDFARTVLEYWHDGLTAEDRAVRLEVRLRRREQVFSHRDPPVYRLLLDESVLHREIGGPKIAADQMEALLGFERSGLLSLRILPFAASAVAVMTMMGAFCVLDLDEDQEDAIVYREGFQRDEVIHTPDAVRRSRVLFDQLWDQALGEEASRRLVELRRAELLAVLSRAG